MSIILHSDLNNFYASCECLHNPEIRGASVVVCGKIEDRHGIVLAKNYIAKSYGIKTGDTLFEARKKCPQLVAVEANFALYIKYSRMVKKIYSEYTDRVESFGIDEAWLDITNSTKILGDAQKIANEIKDRIKTEIGLSVSIGVSFNKIFAKLGSDIKKPDAITLITRDNYKHIVWKLPVENLLFVGRATQGKLNDMGIKTIGDLACTDISALKRRMGKWGEYLHRFANGKDESVVKKTTEKDELKSIGNSITFYRDLKDNEEVLTLIYLLSESVVARMTEYEMGCAKVVRVSVTDNSLETISRQKTLTDPTRLASEVACVAIELFKNNYTWERFVRGVGVSISGFSDVEQILIGSEEQNKKRQIKLQNAIENLRGRFGRNCINRALMYKDYKFVELNIKEDHTIHPVSFL